MSDNKISYSDINKITKELILNLQHGGVIEVDELEEHELNVLESDFKKHKQLMEYWDNDTILSGVLNEFKETSHINVDMLIKSHHRELFNEKGEVIEYNFVPYYG